MWTRVIDQPLLVKFSSSNINDGNFHRAEFEAIFSHLLGIICFPLIITSLTRISPCFRNIVTCIIITTYLLFVLFWVPKFYPWVNNYIENREVTCTQYLHHQMFGIQKEHKCKWWQNSYMLIMMLAVSAITLNLAGTLIFFIISWTKIVTLNLRQAKGTKLLVSERIGMWTYT